MGECRSRHALPAGPQDVRGAAPSLDFAGRADEALRTGGLLMRLQPRIVLQVLPADAGAHAGLDGHFVIAGPDGERDVAYLNNALAGQVVERAQDVARLARLYDILKAEALSPRVSVDLARKAIERWT